MTPVMAMNVIHITDITHDYNSLQKRIVERRGTGGRHTRERERERESQPIAIVSLQTV